MRNSRLELKKENSRLGVRKIFSAVRTVGQCNRLPILIDKLMKYGLDKRPVS